jgi:hypothetical protein
MGKETKLVMCVDNTGNTGSHAEEYLTIGKIYKVGIQRSIRIGTDCYWIHDPDDNDPGWTPVRHFIDIPQK